MTKTDALLYAKDKIRVNSIHPGFIWTPMVEGYLKSQGNVEEGRKQPTPFIPSDIWENPTTSPTEFFISPLMNRNSSLGRNW